MRPQSSKTWPIARFFRGNQGSAAMEFGLVLPAFLSLVIGVIEVANLFFVNSALENAVLHASRYGITGSETSGASATRLDRVREIVERQTFGHVDPDTLDIETLVFEQFSDIGQPEPFADENANGQYDPGEEFSDVNGNGQWDADMGLAGLGNAGDIVLYRITYAPPSLTGFADWATSTVTLVATLAVRNEPF